jgi:hypothetical protein
VQKFDLERFNHIKVNDAEVKEQQAKDSLGYYELKHCKP